MKFPEAVIEGIIEVINDAYGEGEVDDLFDLLLLELCLDAQAHGWVLDHEQTTRDGIARGLA